MQRQDQQKEQDSEADENDSGDDRFANKPEEDFPSDSEQVKKEKYSEVQKCKQELLGLLLENETVQQALNRLRPTKKFEPKKKNVRKSDQ